MWTILKFERKKFYLLKEELSTKLGSNPKFYIPKLKINKLKKNKLKPNEILLLGDYLLCYHEKFKSCNVVNSLKYCKGLKYFLCGFTNSQNEIISFINKCKTHEDQEGFIRQTFFDFKNIGKFKFLSGPFANLIFNKVSESQDKIKVLINNLKITASKNKYLFRPV